jgi:hypothetical protein
MLTKEYLHSLFDYKDGQLIWKVQKANRTQIGSVAGWANRDIHGQQYMNVELDGKSYKVHRIVFVYHHGYMPKRIDHIDGNRFNNNIENLREVTASQNALNSKFRRSNTSGSKNVFFDNRSNKWRVQLRINGRSKSFGAYDNLELADLVATEARDKFHGAYARHF